MLNVAPVDFQLAKYAVTTWHYSHSYPAGTSHRYGVWEDNEYIGCVLYGTGANKNIGRPFQLTQLEVRELCRVALKDHDAPVSQIVAETLRQLKQSMPACRAVVSYADTYQGHEGTIYKAGNWLYLGTSKPDSMYVVEGKELHRRMAYDTYGTSSLAYLREHVDPDARRAVTGYVKHKYVWPFDSQMRRRIQRMAQPFIPAVKASEVTRLVPN